jgi:hypothetical protein
VLDSADVTVTSSEFGLSGLFVARRRYDYSKDIGPHRLLLGPQRRHARRASLHWGEKERRDDVSPQPARLLHDRVAARGLPRRFAARPRRRRHARRRRSRYDYSDEYSWDNPTDETKVRVFGDYFTGALGSSFDYFDWGVRVSLVRPILTPRTLIAVQLMNAFSAPTDSSRVPNQGRYSLGGDLGCARCRSTSGSARTSRSRASSSGRRSIPRSTTTSSTA